MQRKQITKAKYTLIYANTNTYIRTRAYKYRM